MSQFLKQSTAVTLVVGPMLDDTDAKTPETGLTIAQADVRLSKAGGAFAQKGDATSCTHMENGFYSCPLSTTDTGTLGILKLAINESGALPAWESYMVLTASAYDALMSTGLFNVNVTQISGDSTAADNLEAATDGTGYNIGNGSVVAASVTGAVGSVTGNVGGNVTGSVGSVASGGITAASIATNAIDADAIASDAVTEIQSGLATATNLSALDTKIGTPSNLGGGASLAANLADIEAQTDDIGAAGAGLTAIPWNSAWDAEVQSEATDALNAYDPPTRAELTSDMAGIPDAVWDEPISESDFTHTWAGATPRKILAAKFAGFRNKWTSTNSSKVLRNDADSAALGTRSIADDATTYTDGEMG